MKETSPIDLSKIDRLPPHSTEAEQALLGCVLLDPSTMDKVEAAGLVEQAFYDLRHAEIWSTMVRLRASLVGVDLLTVSQHLKDAKRLEQVGSIAYLASLPDAVPSAANIGHYLDILLNKHALRRAIAFCTEFVGRAYEHQGTADELMDALEMEVLALRNSKKETEKPIREVVHEAVNHIEFLHQNQGKITGLSTGLSDLDRMTNGLHPAEVTIVAAFPSCGKTALAMNIVEHAILEEKLPVGVFSLEMSSVSLVTRMIASRARVNLRSLSGGSLVHGDFTKLTTASTAIAASRLFLHSVSDLPVGQMRAIARRMKQQHGIKLLVVDYLQLLDGSGSRVSNREQEVARISKAVKGIATELDIPVLGLSQLNEDGKLRESRSLGQDADNVWILNHDEAKESAEAAAVGLQIAKQRNGPRNVIVPLTFIKGITRFTNAAKVDKEDAYA